MNEQKPGQGAQQTNPGTAAPGGNPNPPQRSPSQQKPPTDERHRGTEQDEKAHRSNLAGDQDTDEPVETEEG